MVALLFPLGFQRYVRIMRSGKTILRKNAGSIGSSLTGTGNSLKTRKIIRKTTNYTSN